MKKYIYVFVRNDLSPSQICVQSTHSCIEVARNYLDKDEDHPNVVVFGIKNENKLKSIADNLLQEGIRFQQFLEPDIGNQLTSIATEPLCGEDRKLFSKYCLLKFKGVDLEKNKHI